MGHLIFFFKETLQCRDYNFISEPRKLCLRAKKLVSAGKWWNWKLNQDHAILAFSIIPCDVSKLRRGSARSQRHILWLLPPVHFIPYPTGFWEAVHLSLSSDNKFPGVHSYRSMKKRRRWLVIAPTCDTCKLSVLWQRKRICNNRTLWFTLQPKGIAVCKTVPSVQDSGGHEWEGKQRKWSLM